jgi:Glucodextranase, domain N
MPPPVEPMINSGATRGVVRRLLRAVRRTRGLSDPRRRNVKEARRNGSNGRLIRCDIAGLRILLATLVTLVASAFVMPAQIALAAGTAGDGPGVAASWTTGNKLAVGTSAEKTGKVWFTVANGITSEVFYPRLDIPNMQDMQYIITDGSTFVDLERDATNHEISMPDEKALEYTVTPDR